MLEGESNGMETEVKDEIVDVSSSSSSAADSIPNQNLDDDHENLGDACQAVLDELVEDAIWDVCFEIHRAVKLGYYSMDETKERTSQTVLEDSEKDIFGQTLKSKPQTTFQISCPSCKKKTCATKFASHLAKCIGVSGRNSSRAASKKIAEYDENDYDSDYEVKAYKKRSKKCQAKKIVARKQKVAGSVLTETNTNYQGMTYEQRKLFFTQMCGVISKRTNRMCMNTHNCSTHTDEQRRDVRQCLLKDLGDQLAHDGQIDVDTVDEGNNGLAFFMQASSAYFSSENVMSPISDLHETTPSTSNKNGNTTCLQNKKSLSLSSSISVPSPLAASGSSFESV